MENRRIVYYKGNTIRRSYSKQSVVKRMAQESGTIDLPQYIIPVVPKVFATKNCMWCTRDFESFKIVCDRCRNCQYCGMACDRNTICMHCGNHMPDEIKKKARRRNTKRFRL